MFERENYGLIKELQDKQQIPTFTKMTEPKVMDSIKALGSQHWNIYKNFVLSESSNSLVLPTVQKLNGYIEGSDVRITYDDGKDGKGASPSFGYKPSGRPGSTEVTNSAGMSFEFQALNDSLKPALEIAKREGKDPTNYVYNLFQQLGANKKLLQAIRNTIPPEPVKAEQPTP
jgi:hypothetical protein